MSNRSLMTFALELLIGHTFEYSLKKQQIMLLNVIKRHGCLCLHLCFTVLLCAHLNSDDVCCPERASVGCSGARVELHWVGNVQSFMFWMAKKSVAFINTPLYINLENTWNTSNYLRKSFRILIILFLYSLSNRCTKKLHKTRYN